MENNLTPLVIDTDLCTDDVLGILYCLGEKKFDIKALCLVAGNTCIERTITKACNFIGRHPQCPKFTVNCGDYNAMRPVLPPGSTEVFYEDSPDVLSEFTIFERKRNFTKYMIIEQPSAANKILEMAKKYERELVILALGPLTNIKAALDIDPDLLGKLKTLVIMGGNCDRATNTVELNFKIDPDAVVKVLNSSSNNINSSKIIIVTLEACEMVHKLLPLNCEYLKPNSITYNTLHNIIPYDLLTCMVAEDESLVSGWSNDQIFIPRTGLNNSFNYKVASALNEKRIIEKCRRFICSDRLKNL